MEGKGVFENPGLMPALALFCAILWSLAYPFIKLGYASFGIASTDLGGKLLFAGLRFLFAGLIVLLLHRNVHAEGVSGRAWGLLVLYALVNTSLHYMFSYIGLGYIPAGRGSVLNSMGSFFLVVISCLVFPDDHMSVHKALGCLLGIGGILLINVNPGEAFFADASFPGDGMVVLNALCSAFGGIIGRLVSRKMDMTRATGLSMALGGAVLCICALLVGLDAPWQVTLTGVLLLFALTLISALAFTIYNLLLASHPISKVAVFNAFIPVFSVLLSCVMGEPFHLKYLVAGLLAALGTKLVNRKS